jgi:hypothetical protein
MNTKSFTELLQTPQNSTKNTTKELAEIINAYPFFQAARAIYLKELKNNESFKYNSELKKTAAYTTDRTILFDFITSKVFKDTETTNEVTTGEVHQQIAEKITIEEPSLIKEELKIGRPISFTQNETHSFNQWLQLSTNKKIEREEPKQLNKGTLIDDFIKKNPKITKISKQSETKEIIIKEREGSFLMTETLAKVYLEQKKYENAIKAYEILSLKYPEKSGFFADQVKRIRILKNK